MHRLLLQSIKTMHVCRQLEQLLGHEEEEK